MRDRQVILWDILVWQGICKMGIAIVAVWGCGHLSIRIWQHLALVVITRCNRHLICEYLTVLGLEPGAMHRLGKCSVTALDPSP